MVKFSNTLIFPVSFFAFVSVEDVFFLLLFDVSSHCLREVSSGWIHLQSLMLKSVMCLEIKSGRDECMR